MLHSIQFLRFIAAFAVTLSHAEFVLGQRNHSLSYAFGLGAIGVHIFFVISGFIMTYTVFGAQGPMIPSDFLRRRFIRIYPIYWIYAGLYISVLTLNLAPVDVLLAAFLLPGYSSGIIGQGWTLSYEVFFYIGFAAIIPLGPRTGLAILSIVFLVLVAIHRLSNHPIYFVITNPLLIEFLLGSWIGLAYVNNFWLPAARLTAVASIALILGGYFFGYQRAPSLLTWGIPSALLITAALAFEREGLPAWMRQLSFLGDSSYSLYLLHAVILVIISQWFDTPERFALGCFIAAITCVILAMPGYYLVERPLVRMLNALSIRPSPST